MGEMEGWAGRLPGSSALTGLAVLTFITATIAACGRDSSAGIEGTTALMSS